MNRKQKIIIVACFAVIAMILTLIVVVFINTIRFQAGYFTQATTPIDAVEEMGILMSNESHYSDGINHDLINQGKSLNKILDYIECGNISYLLFATNENEVYIVPIKAVEKHEKTYYTAYGYTAFENSLYNKTITSHVAMWPLYHDKVLVYGLYAVTNYSKVFFDDQEATTKIYEYTIDGKTEKIQFSYAIFDKDYDYNSVQVSTEE